MEQTTTKVRRRITLILDTAGSRRLLLDILPALFGETGGIELDAILFADESQRRAAALPFVREYSLLTTREREFGAAHLDRAIALCRQGLERSLRAVVRREDIAITVRSVSTAVSLLQEIATASDIMIFGPPRRVGHELMPGAVRGRRRQSRIAVLIDDPSSGAEALRLAGQLAGGDASRLVAIVPAAARGDEPAAAAGASRVEPPARILRVAEAGLEGLVGAARRESPAAIVVAIDDEPLDRDTIELLRRRVHCPVFLVRKRAAPAHD